MVTHLINLVFIGILFADILERRYPNQCKQFIITISYNLIYYFSKLQILVMKYNKNLNTFIESNPILFEIKKNIELIFSKQGTRVMRYFIKNTQLYDIQKDEHEFIILSWLRHDNKCVDNKIIYKNDNYDESMCEYSNIKFLLVEIKIGNDISRKIDLKTDEFNYYLVGNKFTKDFFMFYLNHYLQLKYEIKDTDKITLKIIDHDVNTINLDFTDKNEAILLGKNSYNLSIINHNKEE
jgi:hypothetical protein